MADAAEMRPATEAPTRPTRAALGEAGGFEASRFARRLRGFQPSASHVNRLIQEAGPTIIRRARHLVRNAPYARRATAVWTSSVVGAGIVPQSRAPDPEMRRAIQELWLDWTDEADADGISDLYGLQRRIAREEFIAGEVFVRLRDRRVEDELAVPLQLQLIPAEMVPVDRNEDLGNGRVIRHGIEFDGVGRRVAYHVLRQHPTDPAPGVTFASSETVRVPADRMLHVYDPIDVGQIRGVSRLATAIVKMFILDQYDDAELDRKKVAALFGFFVTSDAPEDDAALGGGADRHGLDRPGDDDILPLEPGMGQRLRPGESVAFAEPADVGGGYEPFQYRTLLQIAAASDVPYALLTGDMTRANYSSVRTAIMDFRRVVEAFQHDVLVYQFGRPVWSGWMDRAVLTDALHLPGYEARRRAWRRVAWLPPRWDWVDPLKDAQAEIAQIRAGLKSRRQAVAERGYDVETMDADIASDRDRADAAGLVFDSDARVTSRSGGGQASPTPDSPEDHGDEPGQRLED